MKEIRLLKLSLRDFQGGTFVFTPDAQDTNVFADNAVGKTRLASAFSWLLFDKDSLGRSDFEIKNLDALGNEEHNLEHSVEGVLGIETDNANEHVVTMKKVYREIWTKKRGSAERTFTGHTTDYFIDGVPVQKKEYTERVAEIAGDESIFRLLTSPTVFPALHWQKQRTLLLDVCGNISDAEVIESDHRLSKLPGILGKRSLEDHRKVIAARRSEINKELERIPVRIDEQRRTLPDIAGLSREKIASEIGGLETTLNDAKLRLQGLDTGGKVVEMTKRTSDISLELRKMEDTHRTETLKAANNISREVYDLKGQIQNANTQIAGFNAVISRTERQITDLDGELQGLRDKWEVIDAETFKDTTKELCQTCEQPLPLERVMAAREKAQAAFNLSRAERLAEIEARGKRLREERDLADQTRQKAAEDVERYHAATPMLEERLAKLTTDLNTVEKATSDCTLIAGYAGLAAEKRDIEDQIKVEKEGRSADTGKIKAEIIDLETRLANEKADLDKFARRESGEKRIAELKGQEKILATEFERLEEELYLCDLFLRAKVSLLTDRINGKFEIVRFKLFEQQVNGGLAECCEITVGGVPFGGGLNSAGRTNAGLDVCRTLSRHYGLLAPVFIDNAESVSHPIKMDSQVIRLVVSEADKVMRVEKAGERMKVAA